MSVASKAIDVLQSRGSARGLFGDSQAWLVVWVVLMGFKAIKKLGGKEQIVVREIVRAGDKLVIDHSGPAITYRTMGAKPTH